MVRIRECEGVCVQAEVRCVAPCVTTVCFAGLLSRLQEQGLLWNQPGREHVDCVKRIWRKCKTQRMGNNTDFLVLFSLRCQWINMIVLVHDCPLALSLSVSSDAINFDHIFMPSLISCPWSSPISTPSWGGPPWVYSQPVASRFPLG